MIALASIVCCAAWLAVGWYAHQLIDHLRGPGYRVMEEHRETKGPVTSVNPAYTEQELAEMRAMQAAGKNTLVEVAGQSTGGFLSALGIDKLL